MPSRTSGAEGGPGKRIGSNPDTAPRPDPYLLGRHWTQVATVVERTTRYTVLAQLDNREMTTVPAGLKRVMPRLPIELRKTLTWDRGMELADHKNVTVDTGLAVYFADPRSPWQRGTNENTGLLRQYLPKGSSMAGLSQDDLDAIAAKLNSRPRRSLGYDTPADRLAAVFADRLTAKAARLRISLARLSSRTSCSSSLTRLASTVLTPATWPSSTSAWRTQDRTDSTP